jgi:hypothetical protein
MSVIMIMISRLQQINIVIACERRAAAPVSFFHFSLYIGIPHLGCPVEFQRSSVLYIMYGGFLSSSTIKKHHYYTPDERAHRCYYRARKFYPSEIDRIIKQTKSTISDQYLYSIIVYYECTRRWRGHARVGGNALETMSRVDGREYKYN